MRAYFVRHGESVSNTLQDVSDLADGDMLTDLGWKQSEKIGKRLTGKQYEKIYVSPAQRAQETASAILEHVDAPAFYFPEIHEVGRMQKEYQCTDSVQRYEYFKEYWDRLASESPDASIEEGEGFNEIMNRVRVLHTALVDDMNRGADSILVITHGAFLRFFLAFSILGDDYSPQLSKDFGKIGTLNTGISEFEITPERFRLITWMDKSHL